MNTGFAEAHNECGVNLPASKSYITSIACSDSAVFRKEICRYIVSQVSFLTMVTAVTCFCAVPARHKALVRYALCRMMWKDNSNMHQRSSCTCAAGDEVFAQRRSRSERCNSIGFLTMHPHQHLLFQRHSRAYKSSLGSGGDCAIINTAPCRVIGKRPKLIGTSPVLLKQP